MSGAKEVLPFVILASGAGSNCKALLAHARKHREKFAAVAVISDRAGAPALDLASELGVETFVVNHKDEGAMLALLKRLRPRWAFLAGYKRIVGSGFLHFFSDKGFYRVLNIHPSLLPAYPGLGGYERAFQDGVKVSGVTVHLVDSGLDTGRVLLQESFEREDDDDLESFMARGRKIEHSLYPKALDLAAAGKIHLKEAHGSTWVSVSGKAR
ncbi:MAG TPA: phosphoribosylglycinamide formyltransferase [Bdellovibrionota bacterium]|jgi:phosphoribosylglycinamide formyltransferase-1